MIQIFITIGSFKICKYLQSCRFYVLKVKIQGSHAHFISHYNWIFENLLIPSQICIFLYILILFNANTIVLINRKVCNELNTTHGYFFNTSFVLISRISQKKIREIKTNDVLKKYPWVVLSSLHMLVPIKKAFVLFF